VRENEDMGQTILPDRAAEPFREGIRPGALGGRKHFADPHAPHTLPERVDADRVPIAEEVTRRGVVGEGVHDRLGRPVCGGVLGDVVGEDPPARVGEDDQDEDLDVVGAEGCSGAGPSWTASTARPARALRPQPAAGQGLPPPRPAQPDCGPTPTKAGPGAS